jgi:hypothetical protein
MTAELSRTRKILRLENIVEFLDPNKILTLDTENYVIQTIEVLVLGILLHITLVAVQPLSAH